MLRDLQDETGGFLAYIPLAYHPDNNELGVELGRQGTATTGFDDLRNLAVGRLFLDNFDHIKTHWIMVTPFLSQTSLAFGVNDLEGTVVREKIYHEAGAHTAQGLSLDDDPRSDPVGAAKIPAERDSFYNVLRVFDDEAPALRRAADEHMRSAAFHTSTATRSTAQSIAESSRSTPSWSTAFRLSSIAGWRLARSTSASSQRSNTPATPIVICSCPILQSPAMVRCAA